MFFPNTSIRYDFIQLLNMPYVNRVNLREQNLSLKCCNSLEILIYFGKGFRSFHTVNMGSVGQRAVKLLAVKVGGQKKSLLLGLGPT